MTSVNSATMYNNYEQLQTTATRNAPIRSKDSYNGSSASSTSSAPASSVGGASTTTYRSVMGPRVTLLQRSRAVGFGVGMSGTNQRIQQNYASSTYSASLSQGSLASLVNASGVAIRGGNGTYGSSGVNAAAAQINATRLREKRDLVFLNDKFAQYLEKVRYLEADNRKLVMEFNYLRDLRGQGSSHIKDMYETEMSEASKLIEECKRESTIAYGKTLEAEEELKRQKGRYGSLSVVRLSDQKEYDAILQKFADNEAQIAVFRRRIVDLEDEIRLYKLEAQRLASEISRVQADIRSELSLRSSCEIDRAAFTEEMISLKETHEAELAEIRSRITSVDLDPSRFFRNELATAIREIRKEYEGVIEAQRNQLQARYAIEINEIVVQVQRLDSAAPLNEENYRELERMRSDLLAAQNQTSQFRAKVQQIQNAVSDCQLKIKAYKESSALSANRLDREVAEARGFLASIEENYNKVMELKVSLEQEIETYRRYLESSDGLRGCVDRIVQNAEQKNYEHSGNSTCAYAPRSQGSLVTAASTSSIPSSANYSYSGPKSPAHSISSVKTISASPSKSEALSSRVFVASHATDSPRASLQDHLPSVSQSFDNLSQTHSSRSYVKQSSMQRNSSTSSHGSLLHQLEPIEIANRRAALGEGLSSSSGSLSTGCSVDEHKRSTDS